MEAKRTTAKEAAQAARIIIEWGRRAQGARNSERGGK
jgi:hypothetical protein